MNSVRSGKSLPWVMLALVTGLALLLAGCDEDDIERTMGKQTAGAVEKEYGVNQDPVLAEWANVMGQRLVGQSFRQNIPYSFKVINTDMVNAFAAPWGYIYLTRGFLNFAKSEDEVAYVVGHEIGHVANRDAVKSVKKSLLFNLGAALLGGKSETLGDLSSIGAGLLLLHYSREDERDADVAGVMNSYYSGYDPAGGEAFFTRLMNDLEKSQPSSLEHLFLTHPATASRIAALRARPEMNLKDPAVASRIGRGYARRYAFAKATRYYDLALQQKPEAVTTRLALAEAYRFQGKKDLATAQYQAVLQRDDSNRQARQGLQALAGPTAGTRLAALGSAEAEGAQKTLSGLYVNTNQEVQSLLGAYQGYLNAGGAQTAAASSLAKQAISSQLAASDSETKLSEKAQGAYGQANAAVSAANDAAFTLEGVDRDMLRIRDLVTQTSSGLRQALEQAGRGQGLAGDVAAYQRGLVEAHHAAKSLTRASEASRATAVLVKRAVASGNSTMSVLGTMLKAKDPERFIYSVKASSQATRQQAAEAQEATRKVKKTTALAEARALLAKLNLAALGATPEVRQAYDGMVAYYCGSRPAEVRELREKGLGFGDAAFLLSAARSTRTDVSTYLGAVTGNQLMEGLRSQGVSFEGPVVLLKYLVNALDEEGAQRAK